jgi:PAT family beta-lactamase induction signal transducer AmpG
MRKTPWLGLTLFGMIYFVEGAVLTYFSTFNALYLRGFDLSFTRIGIMSGITLIPFVLKIFIGLLSDRVNIFGLGHRTPYIVLGLVVQSLAFACFPLVSPVDQFSLFVAVAVLAALGMSTYDTCTDGLSIDTTPEAQRGLVQGVMVGGRALSAIVTALVIGVLSERGLWPVAFWAIAGVGVLTIPLALAVREPSERPPEQAFSRAAFRAFLDGAFVLFLVVGLVYPLVLYSANGMVGAFLHEVLGINLQRVGFYTSIFGIGAVIGGLIGGPLVARLGRRDSLVSALVLTFVVTLGLAGLPTAALAWLVILLFGVAFGYYETVYMAVGMDFADPRIAAFMFAFIMAVGNIGIGLGQPLAGVLVDSVGFRWMFVVLAGVNVLVLPLLYVIFHWRRELGTLV